MNISNFVVSYKKVFGPASLFGMIISLFTVLWGIDLYYSDEKALAVFAFIVAIIAFAVWIGGIALAFATKEEEECQFLTYVFFGGYILIGLLLIYPIMQLNEYSALVETNGDLSLAFQLLDMMSLVLLAASIIAIIIVTAILTLRLGFTTAIASLGIAPLLFVLVVSLFAMAVYGIAIIAGAALVGLNAISRAAQGKLNE